MYRPHLSVFCGVFQAYNCSVYICQTGEYELIHGEWSCQKKEKVGTRTFKGYILYVC